MSDEQLGMLLFKAMHEPRLHQKRWVRDCGGKGTSDELDVMLQKAKASRKAQSIGEKLEASRSKNIEAASDFAELAFDCVIESIRLRMQELGISQADLATACNWPPSLLSRYLSKKQEPGFRQLARIAANLGMEIKLEKLSK